MADMSKIFSKLAMPSPEFLRIDRFEPVANGYIYVGKTDSDPTNPANQIPVFFQQEDGSLVQVSQPIRISVTGYPVYNGKPGKFITQTAASCVVEDVNHVRQWYWPNLFEYDSSQMWNVIASSFGADFVGTPIGTVQEQLNGFVTPWNFVGKAPYADVTAAIQAMFDYAQANNKLVWAVGWAGTLPGVVTATGIKIVGGDWTAGGGDPRMINSKLIGGTWRGRSIWLQNSSVEDCDFTNGCRMRHEGGDVRIINCTFDGIPPGANTCHVVMQNDHPGRNTIEIDGCVFTNGYFGILHQGSMVIERGIYRNLAFFDMQGDGLELNVVNMSYGGGCVIENIILDNINGINPPGSAPGFLSNWGIGIGVAGKGPYGWDIPDDQYCHNFTIRNVYARGCRQTIHVEVGRDFTIENVHVEPDLTKSTATGLPAAGVVCYGSKDFTIDGVTGEPMVAGTGVSPDAVRMVQLEWGITAGAPADPCHNFHVSNVRTKTGWVYAGVAADPGDPGLNRGPHDNVAVFDNINCARFSTFGVATHLKLSNIYTNNLDCVGDDSAGWPDGRKTTSNGKYIRTKSTLELINVSAYDALGYGGQNFARARYSHISVVGGNVTAAQYVNFIGSLGAILGNCTKAFYPKLGPHGGWANVFPIGREFDEGDIVFVAQYDGKPDGNTPSTQIVTGLKPYIVIKAGAYIPDNDDNNIHAAAVGATTIVQQKTPNGVSTGSPWLYTNQFTPGTRITIPGGGAGGADLNTWVVRPPYQTPPDNTGALITMDIAHPLQTAVPEGTRIRATYPIQTWPAL